MKQNKGTKSVLSLSFQKHLTTHILYISHIKVNIQQAVTILLDRKTYVMVTFQY